MRNAGISYLSAVQYPPKNDDYPLTQISKKVVKLMLRIKFLYLRWISNLQTTKKKKIDYKNWLTNWSLKSRPKSVESDRRLMFKR